jgi:dTDP-4-amino-4,6-dideoxygalactose transaminase
VIAPIPFVDLAAGHAELREGLDAAWRRVMASSRFVLGAEVAAFEAAFASYCEARHCVGVANGLDALTLILRALGVGAGDEVIVPGHTFVATWLAVTQAGATPVPVDIDEATLALDPALIGDAIGPRTRAIVPVHLYGSPADMHAIADIAARHGLAVVEDAAQAHGARYRGRRAGGLGVAAGFSFYPAKNLGALGDGGAVVTSDDALAACVRRLRNYGALARGDHEIAGVNSRLDELQAALLAVKLRVLDRDNERRAAAAARYRALLADLPLALPRAVDGGEPAWHLFVVRTPLRDRVRASLAAAGIETSIHYPVPPHRQRAYAALRRRSLPVTERVCGEVLSLPLWPGIDATQQERVASALRDALATA